MSGSEFQDRVKAELEQNGWTVLDSGWPDFLCIKDGKVQAMEVKRDNEKLRPNQKQLLDVLHKLIPTRVIYEGPGFGDSENSKNFCLLVYDPEAPF